MEHILVINPGSTSTKLAIYDAEAVLCSRTIRHSSAELSRFSDLWQQFPFRLDISRKWIDGKGNSFATVIGMGGLFRPVAGGVYAVNTRMLTDARNNLQGEHASNLGCALAHEIAHESNCGAIVADPVSVNEFEPLAAYSGHPLLSRKSLSHALNIHAAARWAAEELEIPLPGSSFVIGHLGGGISVAAVRNGHIIDVNDAASDGPFSPERTGGLPLQEFISLCYSGTYSEHEVRSLVMGRGGLVAYLGTNSTEVVEERIHAGDETAREIYEAMAYQIAKEIGAMSTVLKGNVKAIVLTGGMSQSGMITAWIRDRTSAIAPIIIHPGEDEMKALAAAALRVLRNQETVKEY